MAARRRKKERLPAPASAEERPPPAAETTRTTPGQKLALAVGGTLFGLLLLAAIEGLLGLAGMGGASGDPLAGFTPGHRIFEAREEGGESWLVTRPSKLLWFNEQRFLRRKRGDGLRIFTLGGSTTFGRPYDDQVSFSSWLRLLLVEASPGVAHEVINAGGISYASYRIDVLLREVLTYSPDALVIYTGHNEFLEERTWPELRRGPGALRRARALVSRLRTVTLLRETFFPPSTMIEDALTSRGLADDVRARLDVQSGLEAFHRDDHLRDRIVGEFRENLERIVTRAQGGGVAVVLVKPASNVRDFPPFKSEISGGFEPGDRKRFHSALDEGAKLLATGSAETARARLREAAALEPRHARVRFLLGRAELALGRPNAARPELLAAREEDVCPLRAPAEIAASVAAVGQALGVPVVDLPALLAEEVGTPVDGHLPGNDQFLDHVHPTIAVHQGLAEAVFEALRGAGLRVGATIPAERREALFAAHLDTLDGAYFAQRDFNLGKVLGWAGQLEEAQRAFERAVSARPDDPEVHFYLGMGLEQEGRPAEAAEHYRRSAELAPGHFRARFNLGKALQTLGDAEGALVALQAALELRPADAATHYELARTLGALDRIAEAREALAAARKADPARKGLDEAAAALTRREDELRTLLASAQRRVLEQPGDPAAHNALGEALGGRARDLVAAEAAFREALGKDPGFAPAHRNLAALLQMRGDLVGAQEALSRVVALRPRDARAQLELGILRRVRGDLPGAADAFRRAVTLEPDMARGWINLGAVLAAGGDHAGALHAFEEAVRLAPDDADAHFNLAAILRAAGRESEARRHGERARQLEQRTGMSRP